MAESTLIPVLAALGGVALAQGVPFLLLRKRERRAAPHTHPARDIAGKILAQAGITGQQRWVSRSRVE